VSEIPDAVFPFVRQCGYCKADIVWVVETKGKKESRIPVNATPSADGNMTLTAQGRKLVIGRPTKLAAEAMVKAGVPLFRRHALTCPHAHRWSANTTGAGFASRQPNGSNPIRQAHPGHAPARKEDQRGVRKSERN
jgi:hypothetical protein